MVVHAHYPHGETRVQRQAEALLRRGYEVDVLCLRGKTEAPTELCNGVQVIRLPVRYRNYERAWGKLGEYTWFCLLAMFKLIQLHNQKRYGVVQLHNLPDFLVFAAWWPKLFGARVILDLHDLMPEFYQARYAAGADDNFFVRLVKLQEKLACGFASHVITVSELWRQTLIKRGVPAEKCSVVMNVADHTIFRRPEQPRVKSTNGVGLHLIYHGSITYRYGIDLVLQAMAKVREQAPGLHLTIHGGGEYKPNLEALTKELGLEGQVKFSGTFMPVEELPQLILTADVGVAPYRTDVFTDGIVPTKLMEYAALGLPAIASCTSAVKAYFQETMVEFFTPGDVDDLARCLLTLYHDRSRLEELARGAEVFNQRYNWEKLGNEYVDLIDRLNVKG
jgi:glycosyltransferase involved in cell wall biosynthesis